jgi:fructoselysine-6-P-deglycase FrlB-like protein
VRVNDIEQEILSQPLVWRSAAALASTVGAWLPRPGERVAAIGCGTSWFVAQAFASRREELGLGESDAFTPTELPEGRSYDRFVTISRSGTTTEMVRLGRNLAQTSRPTTAITAVAGSPVADAADRSVVLDFADERSVVQTRFATGALALLRAHLGEDLEPATADAERAIAAPLPVDVREFEHFVFLGHGWTVGLAHEAALKLREAAQAHTESYPAMEYRHGPLSLAGPDTLVWILGTPDPSLADDVATTGAHVRKSGLDPMAELVLIQRSAVALAEAHGLDPDRPPHLSRSVMLP